jgi:hypothetical protein
MASSSSFDNHPDPVSSHVLDTTTGLPANGVEITMYRQNMKEDGGGGGGGGTGDTWEKVESR